jgi:hypothetical protein
MLSVHEPYFCLYEYTKDRPLRLFFSALNHMAEKVTEFECFGNRLLVHETQVTDHVGTEIWECVCLYFVEWNTFYHHHLTVPPPRPVLVVGSSEND